MQIDILTLFPKMFKGPFDESIIKRAKEKKLLEIKIHNLRNWTKDKHKTVDDRPYGGGTGMVLMIEPIYKAINNLRSKIKDKRAKIKEQRLNVTCQKSHVKSHMSKVILLSPQGQVFNQKKARELAKLNHLIIICGHYEGFDERIRKYLVDEEISIGDYILTGGEIPAMVIIDSVSRLIPGVLKKPAAIKNESFSKLKIENLLDYPQYTRPADFKGWKVPKILLSGNHKKIEAWRKNKASQKTKKLRPDLLKIE